MKNISIKKLLVSATMREAPHRFPAGRSLRPGVIRSSLSVVIRLAVVSLTMESHAAPVTWGSWIAVTSNTAISTPSGYTYGGVNFNGSTTTINNGSQDVIFTGIGQNASGSAAGITVASSGMAFQSTGNNSNVASAVGSPQTWATVLDRVIGDDNNSAAIALSALTEGTTYTVQFFSSAPDANILSNSKIASGGVDSPLFGSHAGGGTKSIVATFTADNTGSQSFAITGTEPTYSALVIGVLDPGDATAPEWIATWPQADPLSSTSLTVRAKTNETGTAYFVVLPDGATPPSAAQVKALTDSSDTPVSASGSMALTANTENSAPVAGLSPGTAYDVYIVAEDAVPNLQASPAMVDASTLDPDTTAPDWIATWPQAEQLTTTSITVRAKTNETGTAYYVALADGATPPTADQVKAGNDSADSPALASGSMALTANTENTTPVTGLSPGTAYDVYIVAEDAVPNLQASPAMVDASTLDPDTTAPDWIATWPQAEQLTATSITVRAKTNETGTAYHVVLAAGATAPTADQVKAGNDSADSPALASGSLPVTANSEATAPVTGLTADTSYDVYFIAEDEALNLQTAPSLVSVSLVTPAVVTWGTWTAVTDETAIQTPGGFTYGGVNFNGSTTTIGSVVFTGIAQNASGTANGVTVGSTGFAFQSTGNNSNVSSVVGSPQDWATVLDRVIGDDNNSATIDLSGLTPGTAYTVQFFSNTPDAGLNATTVISSGGVNSAAFGGHSARQTRYIIASFTANSTSQSFSITGAEPTFGALVIGVEASNTYANWISGYSGLNGLDGFNDDADFDGLDNGLENFLGTAPNAGNAGLTAGTLSGNAFTFTHPQNATPASDVSAPVYRWSTDLQTFHDSGASSGGITVDLAPDTDNPVAGTTTVTATVTGTVPPQLFVTLGVSQN